MQSRPPAQLPGVRLLGAALAACLAVPSLAQTGLVERHGSATITQSGSQTTVTTLNGGNTRYSAFDWTALSVPAGTQLWFAQPDSASTSINRVTGGLASNIDGLFGSNGRLVLVNPAGIAFGPGAVVDTAGFTASTLDLSAGDAAAGRLRFDGRGQPGVLRVEGQVLARSGDVVLIAPRVETGAQAIIEARGGDVVLAAGQKVELTGRGLEGIRMEVRAPGDQAINLGTLKGDSVAIFAGRLQHSGLIQARAVSSEGGKVLLQAEREAEVAGTVIATRLDKGGFVLVTADKLVLRAATFIDVRHARGGGEIYAGGGKLGKDGRIKNSKDVDVEEGVHLKADATLSGAGGTVVVWGDDKVKFKGEVSAGGSDKGHKGGDAQVASGKTMEIKGKVEVRSGRDDDKKGPRKAGKKFDANYAVAILPLENQPEEVQAAVSEPVNESAGYLARSALAAQSSEPAKPGERKVVVTALQCSVTQ
jgi:filamentous hemagglutinin family protein